MHGHARYCVINFDLRYIAGNLCFPVCEVAMQIGYDDKVRGRCENCKRFLLVNPKTNLCIICENEKHKDRLKTAEDEIRELRKKNSELYDQLCKERANFYTKRKEAGI